MSTEFESLEPQSPNSSIPNHALSKDPSEVLLSGRGSCERGATSATTLTRMTGRRQKLPAVMPDISLNLWNLLCKNIGKDLSKISMPGKFENEF